MKRLALTLVAASFGFVWAAIALVLYIVSDQDPDGVDYDWELEYDDERDVDAELQEIWYGMNRVVVDEFDEVYDQDLEAPDPDEYPDWYSTDYGWN